VQHDAETIHEPRQTGSIGGELRVHLYAIGGLLGIGIALWLLITVTGYAKRYERASEGLALGATRSVELTLVREDRENLACASNVVLEGLHCAYRASGTRVEPEGTDDRLVLRPYYTVDHVPLLGSGLWSSPGMRGPLPDKRFTVVCNYHVLGAIKSVRLRWATGGAFGPPGQSPPVGTLSGCVIPP
jgi:hypothetical protein